MKKILFIFLLHLSQFTVANPYELKEMADRVKPLGQVHIAGEQTEATVVVEEKKPLTTKEIYQQACAACHAAGIAGAPKFKDPASWNARKSKGLDTLVHNAWNGINAMPAKGTCTSCTKDQIRDLIKYMLP